MEGDDVAVAQKFIELIDIANSFHRLEFGRRIFIETQHFAPKSPHDAHKHPEFMKKILELNANKYAKNVTKK